MQRDRDAAGPNIAKGIGEIEGRRAVDKLARVVTSNHLRPRQQIKSIQIKQLSGFSFRRVVPAPGFPEAETGSFRRRALRRLQEPPCRSVTSPRALYAFGVSGSGASLPTMAEVIFAPAFVGFRRFGARAVTIRVGIPVGLYLERLAILATNSAGGFLWAGHANTIGQGRKGTTSVSLSIRPGSNRVTFEKHGRPVVAVLAVEEYQRLKVIELDHRADAKADGAWA